MNFNNPGVKLTPRVAGQNYPLKLNQSSLDILSLIFEFKLTTAWHVSRFLTQEEQNKYIYLKLRRMWQAGLLESFKVHSESLLGFPVYYMLSKRSLKVLAEQNLYSKAELDHYPSPKTLFSPHLFKHENQVVELASMEAQNKAKDLNINFKGELSSQGQDYKSDKTLEALTPDYTVTYISDQIEHKVFTEFERTAKSKIAQTRKIERYLDFLNFEQKQTVTLRLIFQTQGMEQSFWLNALTNMSRLSSLRIVTTNLSLLQILDQFLKPIYSSEQTVKLGRFGGRLTVDVLKRVKLFEFL
jgi:hypothetical protein